MSSGVGPATLTPTGRFVAAVGRTEYTIQVSGLNVSLAPGTYWLSVSPLVGNDPSSPLMSYVSCTLGANAVGTPAGNNMNSLFVWEVNGLADYTDAFGRDYSLGVAGTLIPEPSAGLLFFACGALVMSVARALRP